MNQRNRTIDLAKGIAITLMVIGHCYCKENGIIRAIYAFHMPFFFILSGMLYAGKWQEHIDFHPVVTCRRMLVPYAVFDTLFCLFVTVLGRPDDIIGHFLQSVVQQILPLRGATVTWYLPCQLMVLCIFVLIAKHIKKPLRIPIFAVLFLTALLIPPADILLPLWRSLIGAGFFAVGFYGKPIFARKGNGLCLICIGAAFLFLAEWNGMVSLVDLRYSNPLLYTANGLMGSYLLYQLCLRFPKNELSKRIAFLGKNSVIILCTHMFFVECIRLIDYKLFDNALNRLGILEGFVFGGIVMLFMIPVIMVYNRYLNRIFGR